MRLPFRLADQLHPMRRCATCVSGILAVLASVPIAAQVVPSVARAVTGTPATFSLSDALRLARTNHPVASIAAGRRMALTGAARQESALPNPTLEWRRENLGSAIPRDEFFSASMPVDVYGRRLVLRGARSAVQTRAVADSTQIVRTLEFEIARAYWNAAHALQASEVATSHRAAVDTIARVEAERARQGAVSDGAALRAQLEADRARLTEATALASAAHARAELARMLSLPFDRVPAPTDSISLRDAPSLPALEQLLLLARDRRSDLVAARARLDETERRQRAERLGSLPGVGVQSGSKRTAGVLTGVIQLGVTIPFFDRNGGARERAAGDALVATGELRATEAAVSADVHAARQTFLSLRDALGVVSSARGIQPYALSARGNAVTEIAAAAYREGAIPLFDLLDAHRIRAETRAAASRAAIDLQLAYLDLLRAVGVPVDASLPPVSPQ